MRRSVLLCALLAVGLLAACSGTPGIRGKVTDGEAKKPLEGATVELLGCDDADCTKKVASQTTGSDGLYEFAEPAPGRYLLTITWPDAPDCPGIQPFETMGRSDDFVVVYAGYGGLGGLGKRRIFATQELELAEGKSRKLDITFACP